MTDRISLEKEAIAFSDANAPHPRIYELAPEEGRALLEEVQGSPVNKYSVDIEDLMVDTGEWGKIFRSARILSLSFQNIVDHLKRNIQQQLNKIMLCCNS